MKKLTTTQLQKIIDESDSFCYLNDLKNLQDEFFEEFELAEKDKTPFIDFKDFMTVEVINELNGMDTAELIELWNDYCEVNNYYEDQFNSLDEFNINDDLRGVSPYDLLRSLSQSDFDLNDDYYTYDGWGSLTSYNEDEIDKKILRDSSFEDFVYDNQKILDDIFDMEEIIEELIKALNNQK